MKAQAESRQTLVLGVYAREFPGGLLKLDPAFAYADTTTDPKLWSLKDATTEAHLARSCALQQEKPLQ